MRRLERHRFLARRLTFAAMTVIVAVTVNFALFRLAPGSPTDKLARTSDNSPAARAQLERSLGLDGSLPEQYARYLARLARGDLGASFENRRPVADNLREDLSNTLPLLLLGTLVGIALGIVAGVLAAWRRRRWPDHAAVLSATVLFALPVQWLGLMAILAFGDVLPSGGRVDPFLIGADFWTRQLDVLEHMVLPAAVLAASLFGGFVLIMRSSMLETLGEDYIAMARAKGLTNLAILRRHAFRNALLPTVSFVGLTLGFVVGGALLVETVFSWPGIGSGIYQAVLARDYPMLQGGFLLLTVSVVLCNLLADLLLLRLDPRTRT